jgi:hypothetical protein
MKHRASQNMLKKYYITIGFCWVIIVLLELSKRNTGWVEQYYAQLFYPAISYLYIILFSWIPFSVGDVFYAAIDIVLIYNVVLIFRELFKKHWHHVKLNLSRIITLLSIVYILFTINWGLNYFRQPIADKFGFTESTITREDHLQVLDKYIAIANELREKVDVNSNSKNGVKGDLTEIVLQDTLLQGYLCKTQIRAKEPISSELASYFTVSGYFNPFTLEVQVNQLIPNPSYPFVLVHELTHQMGVGFEDECNFIAFLTLKDNADLWYKYSAYYSAVEYLLHPLYGNKELFEQYKSKLSPKVLADFKAEREFWMSYSGWIDKVSGIFYNQFLKHNNQPEGLERYSMMTTLLVAWEKQQEKLH